MGVIVIESVTFVFVHTPLSSSSSSSSSSSLLLLLFLSLKGDIKWSWVPTELLSNAMMFS